MNRLPSNLRSTPRHPYETLLLAACAFGGGYGLWGHPSPSVADALPAYATTAWCILLLVGGTIGLIGPWWRYLRPRDAYHQLLAYSTGLTLEVIGLIAVGAGVLVYMTAIYVLVGWIGLFAVSFNLAFAVASIWRAAQIIGALRASREMLKDGNL